MKKYHDLDLHIKIMKIMPASLFYGPAPLINFLGFFCQGSLPLAPLDRCTYAQRQIWFRQELGFIFV